MSAEPLEHALPGGLSASTHSLIVERSSDGIFIAGPDGRFLDANPAGVAMLGYTREELLQRSFQDLVDPRSVARQALRTAELRQVGAMRVLRPMRRKDGSTVFAEVSATQLPDGCMLGIARDVTRQVRTESLLLARLRLSEQPMDVPNTRLVEVALEQVEGITDSLRAQLHEVVSGPDAAEVRLRPYGSTGPDAAAPPAWAGCVLTRAPVLLEGVVDPALQEGWLPEWRAAGRLLLVPVIRGDAVVAVLSAGGRGTAYTADEADAASQIGGYAIETVRRRQAEASLAAANAALEARVLTRTAALEREKRSLQSLLETAIDGIHVLNEDGDLILFSHSFARMLGYSLEEAVGLNVRDWDAMFPQDQLIAAVRAIFLEPRTFETRHRRKDGTVFDVEINATATVLGGMKLLYASARDISDRKRAAEQYRCMVDNTSTGFVVVDPQGCVIEANANYLNMIGRQSAEVIGRSVLEWTAEDRLQANAEALARCQREGRITDLLMVYTHLDGRRVPVSINAAVMPAEQGAVIVAYCRDMTVEQHLMEELHRSNRELEEFAHIASHDLQEPLRMVASYTELLAERYRGQLDERADRYIFHAVDGARRMQTLISDILAYSRLNTRSAPLEPVSTSEALAAALGNLSLAIQESSAEITEEGLPWVLADRRQLVQLFQNLVGNALKFRGEAPPRVHVSAMRDGQRWRFSVRDNGIGMEMASAERIFRVFQRLHGRDRYPGNGIGLAIVKKIVERHSGKVWVEAEPGQGANFLFTLPAHPSPEDGT